MSLAAHLEYRLGCIHSCCRAFADADSNFCTVHRRDGSELGIGAADHGPRFAVDSKRLDDGPGARIVLFALEVLGKIAIATLFGLAFGLLMLRLQAT